MLMILSLLFFSGLALLSKIFASALLVLVSWVQARRFDQQPELYVLQQLDRVTWQWQQSQVRALRQSRASSGQTQKRTQPPDLQNMQARLLRVEAWLGCVVILHFEMSALGKTKTWLIWRDQVDTHQWRRLQVLQQYWSAPLH